MRIRFDTVTLCDLIIEEGVEVKLVGTAGGPASMRTVNTKKHGARTVYELQVLDDDGGIVTVQTWRGTNLWPDAKVGTKVTIAIGRVSTYLGQTRATVAGEQPGD